MRKCFVFLQYFLGFVWYYKKRIGIGSKNRRKYFSTRTLFIMSYNDDKLFLYGRQPSCQFCLKVYADYIAEENLFYIGACVWKWFTKPVSSEF